MDYPGCKTFGLGIVEQMVAQIFQSDQKTWLGDCFSYG